MDSKELNRYIREICDEPGKYEYEAFGGKAIPYIGWFWRDVNFDRDTYLFGILPPEGRYKRSHIGFMESNKWGHAYVQADRNQWAQIKKLLVQAVEDPTTDNLDAVYMAIQALGVQRKIMEGWEIEDERE